MHPIEKQTSVSNSLFSFLCLLLKQDIFFLFQQLISYCDLRFFFVCFCLYVFTLVCIFLEWSKKKKKKEKAGGGLFFTELFLYCNTYIFFLIYLFILHLLELFCFLIANSVTESHTHIHKKERHQLLEYKYLFLCTWLKIFFLFTPLSFSHFLLFSFLFLFPSLISLTETCHFICWFIFCFSNLRVLKLFFHLFIVSKLTVKINKWTSHLH